MEFRLGICSILCHPVYVKLTFAGLSTIRGGIARRVNFRDLDGNLLVEESRLERHRLEFPGEQEEGKIDV